jgi:DNA-binding CsgD family transcriptional regulator
MAFSPSTEFLTRTIANIYDCAVDPTRWQETLCQIRDDMDLAYLQLFFADPPDDPTKLRGFLTPWDQSWMQRLFPLLPIVPGIDEMRSAPIDSPLSQMEVIAPDAFQETTFFREWAGPQGLIDACNTTVIRRPTVEAWFSGTTRQPRGLFTDTDREAFRLLAPHIRRALLISELIDEGSFQLTLHRKLLNQLSIAIWMVASDGKILLTNTSAEQMLGQRATICDVAGRLRPVSAAHRDTFQSAIQRACLDETTLGTWGNGMALPGADPDRTAVAYVLPMGNSDRRHALGPGQAAVFITQGQNALPLPIEVLSAVTGLTLAEARVALEIAQGTPPETIAQQQGLSVHTVRKPLSNTYEKTGLNSQSALSALVNRYRLPVLG